MQNIDAQHETLLHTRELSQLQGRSIPNIQSEGARPFWEARGWRRHHPSPDVAPLKLSLAITRITLKSELERKLWRVINQTFFLMKFTKGMLIIS